MQTYFLQLFKMTKLKFIIVVAILLTSQFSWAGGLLTNTNQSVTFLRNPARDAAIAIDGVYFNPAGVVFLNDGWHLSINIQNAHQTRSVNSTFGAFAFGTQNEGKTNKTFKGVANAPILPALQTAYNKGKWSFQFNFAVTGGGGKAEFAKGLGSFESSVAMLPLLSGHLDALTTKLGLGALGLPAIEQYDMDTYMRGRQYYFGFTLGTAYQINDHLSVYGGLRLLYGNANYYGYVRNIKVRTAGSTEFVNAPSAFTAQSAAAFEAAGKYAAAAEQYAKAGNVAAATAAAASAKDYKIKGASLGALGIATQDVTLNCDQTGWGLAPILGIDYKTGDFNFAAKYEFKTSMRLKNKSANSESAKNLKQLAKFEDGKEVEEDSPSLLTVGAQWSVLPTLRLNAGWHHYFDKNAHLYNNKQKLLGGDTNEYLFGAEYDINKRFTVSGGTQVTRYQMTDEYMEDISFNVNSYSFGLGVGIHLNKKMTLNLAYFQTNYTHYKRNTNNYNNLSNLAGGIVGKLGGALGMDESKVKAALQTTQGLLTTPQGDGKSLLYGADDFTRTNRVFGIGLDIDF